MAIGVLSWTNETGLNPYPLTKGFGYDSFLIDANFVQFDGFIPVLNSVTVTDDEVSVVIQFDTVLKTVTLQKTFFATSGATHIIRDNGRYLGKLVFGADAARLVDNEMANLTTKTISLPFLASTVRSIPSTAGVFALESIYGAIEFNSDSYISYDTNGQDVTFNAVSGLDYSDDLYLKTLNLIGPVNNSVYIKDTQVIKVRSAGNASIEISLVGTEQSSSNQPGAVIVTSG